MAEKFDNAALFLRLSLPSTPIRHGNGAFCKRSSNRRNFKTPALRLSVDGKHFKNGAFGKRISNRRNLKRPALRFRVDGKDYF